jgi:hypothetical protein
METVYASVFDVSKKCNYSNKNRGFDFEKLERVHETGR